MNPLPFPLPDDREPAYPGRGSSPVPTLAECPLNRDWFCDARSEVVATCEELLRQFAGLGAQLVDVPIPDLRLIAIAHVVTIHTEMAANMERYDRGHRRDFSLTTRLRIRFPAEPARWESDWRLARVPV